MEKTEIPAKEGGRGSSESGGEGRSWARVVQGQPRQPAWTSHKISEEEIEDLQRYFSSVLELPEGVMEDSRRQWESVSVFVRSLGRRVPVEWVVKEVRLKSKLDYDPEGFSLAEEHHLLRFRTAEDCSAVLRGGPWFVAGQLLAMEPWEADFVPGRRMISKTVVWLRLPALPMEFWVSPVVLAIAAEAGKPLATDGFTDMLRKTGFARIRVEIDAGKPLKPGVLVKGRRENFWQPFVYENLPSVCFRCGRLGHSDEGCRFVEGVFPADRVDVPEKPVSLDGVGGIPMVVEGADVAGPGDSASGRPRLGPWLVTSRIRQPRGPRVPVRARKEVATNTESSEPNSSSSRPDSPRPRPSSPSSPPHSDGWQKPTKVARRRSPVERAGEASGGRVNSAELDLGNDSGFRALGPLGDRMELGLPEEPGPSDLLMLEAASASLKRPRSPPEAIKPTAAPASDKVSTPPSHLHGDCVGCSPRKEAVALSGGEGGTLAASAAPLKGDLAYSAGVVSSPAVGCGGEGSLSASEGLLASEMEGRLVGGQTRLSTALEASSGVSRACGRCTAGVDGSDGPEGPRGGAARPSVSPGRSSGSSTERCRRSSGEVGQSMAKSGGAAAASEWVSGDGGEGVPVDLRLSHKEATGRLKSALLAVEEAAVLKVKDEEDRELAGKPAQSS